MKTLVIHPKDSSTTFLEEVYENVPDKKVLTGEGFSKFDIIRLINESDRVMMMGHGSGEGLFNIGGFSCLGLYIIDKWLLPTLRKKDDNVFIWCNADKFVNEHNLKGFYSGMFISEVTEANYCQVYGTTQKVVDESNYGFVNIIGKHINGDTEHIFEKVTEEYGLIAESNKVASYNLNRLYANY